MEKKYIVTLTADERQELEQLLASGQAQARKLTHARILLKADSGTGRVGWTDEAIRQAVEVSLATIARVRQNFVEAGLEFALNRCQPKREYQRKIDGETEARLTAIACSEPPAGRARWTLRLLANELVRLEYLDCVSYETVREVLKKTNSSRG